MACIVPNIQQSTLNKLSVHERHKNQWVEGYTNDSHISDIVNILGGIDSIMLEYLADHFNPQINEQQLHQLNNLLQTPNKNEIKPPTRITLYFDEQKSFLNILFGIDKSKPIFRILQNTIIKIAIQVSICIWIAMYIYVEGVLYYLYSITLCTIIWIPYWLCWILSFNADGFKLLIITFEFWLKVICGCIFGVLFCFWSYHADIHNGGYAILGLITNTLITVIVTLIVVGISAIDAIRLNRVEKILLTMTMALLASFFAIAFHILQFPDYMIFIFSAQDLLSSTAKIFAIFLWKQVITTCYRIKRAVLIKRSIIIKWIDRDQFHLKSTISSENDDIDPIQKAAVYHLHQQRVSNGVTHDDNMLELIYILGGIDKVLSDYLSIEPSENTLNNVQLYEIHQVLVRPQKIISKQTVKNTYYLHRNDTYLHHLFGDKNAETILNMLHHKITKATAATSMVFYWILISYASIAFDFLILYIGTILLVVLFYLPFSFLWVLSANTKAFQLVIGSFEFWFKVSYGLIYGGLWCAFSYSLFDLELYVRILGLIANISQSVIALNMVIIAVSAFDAIKLNTAWKLSLAISSAVSCTCASLFFQMLHVIWGHDRAHSIRILLASTLRILAIFFWRQAIMMFVAKHKSALIRESVTIEWVDSGIQNISKVKNIESIDQEIHDHTIVYHHRSTVDGFGQIETKPHIQHESP